MESVLELKRAKVMYGGVTALTDCSVEIRAGEILALMGPNGAGKSTVLKSIFGLIELKRGQVLWHSRPINPQPHYLVSLGVSFVPQGRRVFAHLTVAENLEIAGFVVHDKAELKRRIDEAMEIFPILLKKRNYKSGTLSGGEQQMLALARGLITNPQILLLDEPSLGLAPKIVKEVFAKIKEINESHKMAIVVVEHNIKSLLEIVSRAYILDKGLVIKEGKPAELMESGILEQVFLGQLE